jgi:hypothetical protein
VSVNKLRRPLEEMTSTSVPNPNEPLLPMPAEPFDFASVPVGSQYLALSGDRTLGGQLLTGVNETRFKNPVPQQGGGDYMRREDNPEGAFWASHRNVISGYKNKLDELQEEVFSDKYQKKYPGADIYATTAAMAPESGDFSLQTTRSVMESMRRQPMAKTARDTLYDAIDAKMKAYWKEDFPEVPNWPGMRSKRVDAFLEQTAQAGKKLTKMLDSNEFAKLGGPDIGAIRKAITHPELLDAPLLATGHRIWRVGPEAVEHITDPRLSHDDYASQLAARGGEFMGGGHTIPGKRFWDFAKAREGMNESHLQRGFNMNRVVQQHTQEWLDKLMSYIDSPEGKKLGVAGAIGAGLLTSAEALELFGTDGSSPDQI